MHNNPVMTTAQASLTKQVLKWPTQRRIELAEELLASVETFATADLQTAWDKEIGVRVKEIRGGGAEGIPAEEVVAEAHRKLHE